MNSPKLSQADTAGLAAALVESVAGVLVRLSAVVLVFARLMPVSAGQLTIYECNTDQEEKQNQHFPTPHRSPSARIDAAIRNNPFERLIPS